MKKIFLALFLLFLLLPVKSLARTPDEIFDWYIKDFQSEIVVNKDNSATITERIIADCGNLPDKHGIFRVLPTKRTLENGKVMKNPIILQSITDFSGNPIEYSASSELDTLTWKIGDPYKTVTGENTYQIVYTVRNIIDFYEEYDEFYWNLTGNFWEIDIDNFFASITFPEEILLNPSQTSLMSGRLGVIGNSLSGLMRVDSNFVEVSSQNIIYPGEGISLKTKFAKGFFQEPPPTFMDKYGPNLALIIFLIFTILPIALWFIFGKDPKLGKPVVPEFSIPYGFEPMELGNIKNFNSYSPKLVTAEIVQLAVKGYIRIRELEKAKILGIKLGKDYEFILLKEDFSSLKDYQKRLLELLFTKYDRSGAQSIANINDKKKMEAMASGKSFISKAVKISDLPDNLGLELQSLHGICADNLTSQAYFSNIGFILKVTYLLTGLAFFIGGIVLLAYDSNYFGSALFFSGILIFILAFFMSKRTVKGAEALWKVNGFRLYMTVAEKYRQEFNEKENIFEKFLPYAIVFGLTDLWAKKMKEIYGESYFNSYHPVWFAGNVAAFDVNSFTTSMNQVTSAVSSAASVSSGGGAGGGGGGGGGGGW